MRLRASSRAWTNSTWRHRASSDTPTANGCPGSRDDFLSLTTTETSAMITLYQYMPACTGPCISPYVTKVAYYMKMAGLPFEAKPQDLTRLDRDTPAGKLPCIVDTDGTRDT